MPEEKKAPAKKPQSKKTPAKKTATKKKKVAKKKPISGFKVNVYSIEGEVKHQTDLPPVFKSEYRPDLIRRAVKASRANRRQPYGPMKMAGMQHAASQWGKGRGVARVQRMTQGRTAVESPPNVGGRRAHPPRPEKDWSQKINKKEKRKALASALAALRDPELVSKRGHKINDEMTLPIVLENDFEDLSDIVVDKYPDETERRYTKEALEILNNLGLDGEIQRVVDGKHIRAGRGKMRGRKYRKPKGILFVVSNKEGMRKCLTNIPGVEVSTPKALNIELLAPGGDAGRLTIFTEAALKELEV